MKVYEVGGCVRDRLLGREPKDIDYVVVGSSFKEMVAAGYTPIDATFPIFVKDGNEYALARTERKTGEGYRGFEVYYGREVTLVEDLMRRDLTINAIAWDPDTQSYIDPSGGIRDLITRTARPVSIEAFVEDPLRVFRALRFAAVYELTISVELIQAIQRVVNGKEIETVAPERVFLELKKVVESAPNELHIYQYLMRLREWVPHLNTPSLDLMSTHCEYFPLDVYSTDTHRWWCVARLCAGDTSFLEAIKAPNAIIKRVELLNLVDRIATAPGTGQKFDLMAVLIYRINRCSPEALTWNQVIEFLESCRGLYVGEWRSPTLFQRLYEAYHSVNASDILSEVKHPGEVGKRLDQQRKSSMKLAYLSCIGAIVNNEQWDVNVHETKAIAR